MAEEPEHILRARALLARQAVEYGAKPAGITTIFDVLAAERALKDAQQELRAFSAGTDGMRETIDKSGVKGLVVDDHRLDRIEQLQARVTARHLKLRSPKRSWLEA